MRVKIYTRRFRTQPTWHFVKVREGSMEEEVAEEVLIPMGSGNYTDRGYLNIFDAFLAKIEILRLRREAMREKDVRERISLEDEIGYLEEAI